MTVNQEAPSTLWFQVKSAALAATENHAAKQPSEEGARQRHAANSGRGRAVDWKPRWPGRALKFVWKLLRTASGQTAIFFALTAGSYYALGANEGSGALTKTQKWRIWKFAVALGVALASIVAVLGIKAVIKLWDRIARPRWLSISGYLVMAGL
jgi:hypothetical protein